MMNTELSIRSWCLGHTSIPLYPLSSRYSRASGFPIEKKHQAFSSETFRLSPLKIFLSFL